MPSLEKKKSITFLKVFNKKKVTYSQKIKPF